MLDRKAVKRSRHTTLEGESAHVRRDEREELERFSEMQWMRETSSATSAKLPAAVCVTGQQKHNTARVNALTHTHTHTQHISVITAIKTAYNFSKLLNCSLK